MRLTDHFTGSGGFLFRWRSYLPLVLLPAFLLSLLDSRDLFGSRSWERAWGLGCLCVSLLGLAIRAWTTGTAPPGASERGTIAPYAGMLNTKGIYSIVRHPLYVGNTVIALGMALFSRTWYLPVIVVLAALLYHERICAQEEVFLEDRFGDEFRAWAARVPAFVPTRLAYEPAGTGFRWRKVVGRELHGLFAIGASFFVLAVVRDWRVLGRLSFDPFWTALFIVTGTAFAAFVVLKRGFGFFR